MKKQVNILLGISLIILFFSAYGYSFTESIADKPAYVDISTGHKYIKNTDNTYTEFTKKGTLFKTNVPADQPHLSKSRYIIPVDDNTFFSFDVYNSIQKTEKILPFFATHPKDWRLKDVLYQYNAEPKKEIGLGYTKSNQTVPSNKKFYEATANAYFDESTGHRYVKNSDNTYREYSLKGKLLRSDVPCYQPHLNLSRYISEMNNDNYLMYEKYEGQKRIQQILPSNETASDHWRCRKLFFSAKQALEK